MKPNATLYQVVVTDSEEGIEIPIGPMMDDQKPLEGLAEKVNLGILRGKIHGWRDAHIVVAKQGA